MALWAFYDVGFLLCKFLTPFFSFYPDYFWSLGPDWLFLLDSTLKIGGRVAVLFYEAIFSAISEKSVKILYSGSDPIQRILFIGFIVIVDLIVRLCGDGNQVINIIKQFRFFIALNDVVDDDPIRFYHLTFSQQPNVIP